MYVAGNPKSKTELKRRIANGDKIKAFAPGIGHGNVPDNGTVSVEGPHWPKPHRWYGTATITDGYITNVK